MRLRSKDEPVSHVWWEALALVVGYALGRKPRRVRRRDGRRVRRRKARRVQG